MRFSAGQRRLPCGRRGDAVMATPIHPDKLRAIHQWSHDPCGPRVDGVPGSRAYFDGLDAGRQEYAPWMEDVLQYGEARGKRVLDLGCGQGIDLVRYARHGGIVTGVDLTPEHVMLARQHLSAMGLHGTVVEGDAENLPFKTASFDAASSNGVLHHTPDMPRALRELRRVCRPGARVTIIVYNRSSLHYWLHQFLVCGILHGGLVREAGMAGVLSAHVEATSVDARPLVRVYTPRQVRRMLCDAGFTEVATLVRGLRASDTIPTRAMARSPGLLDCVGRRFGWYVIGHGTA